MAIRFEALEPSFSLTGNAPQYNIQFVNSLTDALEDPDSVDRLEIYDSNGNLLRQYVPPEILNTAVGQYQVQDIVLDTPGVLQLRWFYTIGGNQTVLAVPFEVATTIVGQGEQQIKSHVLAMLGEGRMKVELPAGTLDFCLILAKNALVKQISNIKRYDLQLVAGQSKYDLPSDAYFVTNVAFENSLTRIGDAVGAYGIYGFTQLGLGGIPMEDLFHSFRSHGFYGSMVQALQYVGLGRRVLSAEPAWEWIRSERKLYMYPCPSNSQLANVEYGTKDVDTDNLYPEEYYFLQQLTLAEALIALGRIRSKYASLPGAEGGIQLDGDALKSEGEQMKLTITDQLRQYAPQGWIVRG